MSKINDYAKFVDTTTSEESKEFAAFTSRIIKLDAERFHMKRELGDILWYWIQGCVALGYTPDEVMDENIKKLEARYPNGFEVARSEKREVGDI